jgi:hypothetical protein
LKDYEKNHRFQGKIEELVHKKTEKKMLGVGKQERNANSCHSLPSSPAPPDLPAWPDLQILVSTSGLGKKRAPELTVKSRSTDEGSSLRWYTSPEKDAR